MWEGENQLILHVQRYTHIHVHTKHTDKINIKTKNSFKKGGKSDIMVHTFNPSTWRKKQRQRQMDLLSV